MENQIKKLIEKWEKERLDRVGNEGGDASSDSYFVINDMIDDLKSLFELYQSQKVNIINDKLENVITVSLVGIKNRTDFRKEIENLYVKYRRMNGKAITLHTEK